MTSFESEIEFTQNLWILMKAGHILIKSLARLYRNTRLDRRRIWSRFVEDFKVTFFRMRNQILENLELGFAQDSESCTTQCWISAQYRVTVLHNSKTHFLIILSQILSETIAGLLQTSESYFNRWHSSILNKIFSEFQARFLQNLINFLQNPEKGFYRTQNQIFNAPRVIFFFVEPGMWFSQNIELNLVRKILSCFLRERP